MSVVNRGTYRNVTDKQLVTIYLLKIAANTSRNSISLSNEAVKQLTNLQRVSHAAACSLGHQFSPFFPEYSIGKDEQNRTNVTIYTRKKLDFKTKSYHSVPSIPSIADIENELGIRKTTVEVK